MLMSEDTFQEQHDSTTTIVEALVRWKPNCIKPLMLLCSFPRTSDVRWDINVSDAASESLLNIKMIPWETA